MGPRTFQVRVNLVREAMSYIKTFDVSTWYPQNLEKLIPGAVDKFDNQVTDIADQVVVDASQSCDVDGNKALIDNALRNALNDLLVSILDYFLGIRESFEDGILPVPSGPKSLAQIASEVARVTVTMAPDPCYAAKIVKQEVEESVEDLVLTLPPLPPSS